jgi:hypothetical protein
MAIFLTWIILAIIGRAERRIEKNRDRREA